MSFRTRILAALLAVGLLPVAMLGLMSWSANRQELVATASAAQAQAAADLARQVETLVLNAVEHLESTRRYLPLSRLTPGDAAAALEIPYRQLPWVNVVVLLSERGDALVSPVFERGARAGAPPRDPVGPAELDAFARSVPLATALASDVAIGPPYVGSGTPRVALAVQIDGPPRRVLAAELSLSQLAARVQEAGGAGGAALLVDGRGQVIARGHHEEALSAGERALVEEGVASLATRVRTVRDADGRPWLAAFAPVGTVGWGVVLSRSEAVALRAADRARAYTLFWSVAALVTAAVLGAFLARGVSVPVAKLSQAARAVTEGRYDTAVPEDRRDELGELAVAFNHMAREVSRRDEEIRGWAGELSRRVEERTSELRVAQDQVARARRLAAIGSLGAGVAHEINNPMTAVVGLVSMARKSVGAESQVGELLGTALEQAMRVTRIVDDLRQLTEQQRQDPGTRFPLAAALQAALEIHAPDAERAGVALRASVQDGVRAVQGDPVQIQHVVGHLLRNAIAATPEGGEIRVSLSEVGGDALKLSVTDTGRGIPAAMRERIFDPFFARKERGGGVGLGLSISNCIVEAHHGTLRVESEEGKGSTFTLLLPVAGAQAHLA
jgi:signal transduction histidine kinase